MLSIFQSLVPKEKWDIKCPYAMKPEYIVVHNTANDASARNEISYMTRNDKQISFHYAVDDKEVIQGISDNRNAWHAGDGAYGNGNRKGIAIEICYSKSGGVKFDKAEQNAAELIAMKMKEYNIPLSKVKRHYDFATDKKRCPHRTMDKGWERFFTMVQKAYEGSETASKPTAKPKPTTSTKYKVGTVVCTNTLATSSTGGKVYKGDWKGTITKVIAGAKYPYLLNNGTGWTNDTGIDTDPHVPSTNTGSASTSKPAAPKKQTVTLPKTAKEWRVYKTNVAPIVGNECGKLKPSKFGGLTYEILAKPQKDVVTIQTQDYGKVNIYVGKGTGAIIK